MRAAAGRGLAAREPAWRAGYPRHHGIGRTRACSENSVRPRDPALSARKEGPKPCVEKYIVYRIH